MHVGVTVLGAGSSGATRAANNIVGYLEGNSQNTGQPVEGRRSQPGSQPAVVPPEVASPRSANSTGGYYVDPEAFRRVLLGQDPNTGEQLLEANGSSGRARGARDRAPSLSTNPDSLLSSTRVAAIAGVDVSYIRRLAGKTAKLRAEQAIAVTGGLPLLETPKGYLDASKDERGRWVVAAGMNYIEREGFHVRRNGNREVATNMVAASYRHNTNRGPRTPTPRARRRSEHGDQQARRNTLRRFPRPLRTRHPVQGSGRHRRRRPRHDHGDLLSSRRQDVLSLSEEMGFFTANARQKAALATRPGKDHSVKASELQQRWREVLNEVGFDVEAVNDLRDRNDLRLWSPTDTERLFVHLGSHRGVTKQ